MAVAKNAIAPAAGRSDFRGETDRSRSILFARQASPRRLQESRSGHARAGSIRETRHRLGRLHESRKASGRVLTIPEDYAEEHIKAG